MAKSFFYKETPEKVLDYLDNELSINDAIEMSTYFWVVDKKIQICKPNVKAYVIPNIVLDEDITPQGQIVPDERAREIFAALKKKFGRPLKEVEDYYFPGQELA